MKFSEEQVRSWMDAVKHTPDMMECLMGLQYLKHHAPAEKWKIQREDVVAHWVEGILQHPHMIECFWPSQIKSKIWLAEWQRKYLPSAQRAIIFGCWYGVLADILDIDQIECQDKEIGYLDWVNLRYKTHTGCLSKFEYYRAFFGQKNKRPDVVINTITEHLTQEIYDEWYAKIPEKTYYIIQGNDDSSLDDHVRTFKDLDEFNKLNNVKNCLDSGVQEYQGPWNFEKEEPTFKHRFMTIGFKDVGENKSS